MNMYYDYPGSKSAEDLKEGPPERGVFATIGFAITEIIKGFFDSIQILVVLLALFVVVYLWILSPHQVDGKSMMPNFVNKEMIIADKIVSKMAPFKRGDVIIFKYDDTKDFIKRVVGLPGEKVKLSGGKVYINGVQLKESYIPSNVKTLPENIDFLAEGQEKTVPANSYFCLGDNREASTDSRAIGFIDPSKHEIRGRVVFVMWPVSSWRMINEVKDYNL
jgi:signal peptidase I